MRTLLVFLLCVFATYVIGSATSSWQIASNVAALGLDVSFSDRLTWIGHDLAGMTGLYLPIVAAGLAIAFAVTALVLRWLPGWRSIGYVLAGGVGLLVTHLVLYAVLDIHALAVTRTTSGLATQVLAGMAGGYLFARATRRASASPATAT
jgi:hypothetical protein